jgi:hypothetical protein
MHPSNKNIYDVSLTFDDACCPLESGTKVTGVATYDTKSGTVLILALNSDKSDGIVYVAARYATSHSLKSAD